MPEPLAQGEKIFYATYPIATPPQPEVVASCIKNISLFPVILGEKEVLVFGSFEAIICYSYNCDGKTKSYQVISRKETLVELISLTWNLDEVQDTGEVRPILEQKDWQCQVEPITRGAAAAAQEGHTFARLFNPRPRNLLLTVQGQISISIAPEEKTWDRENSKAEDDLPYQLPSHDPITDKLVHHLQELIASQGHLAEETRLLLQEVSKNLIQAEKGSQKAEDINPTQQDEETVHPQNTSHRKGGEIKEPKRPPRRYSFYPLTEGHSVSDLSLKRGTNSPLRSPQKTPAPGRRNQKEVPMKKEKRTQAKASSLEEKHHKQPGKGHSIPSQQKQWPDLSSIQPPPKPPGEG